MILVKANRNQRLGNLLFNIGMAYTIQSKLPNHPEIYCLENNLTRTEYFRNTLKPIFFGDIKFVERPKCNFKGLKLVRGGQYKLVNPPIRDNVFLTWHWQNCIELDIELLRQKYNIPNVEQFCKTGYPQVFCDGKETIGIHVRRSDYVTFKNGSFFHINDAGFYKRAVDQIDQTGKNIMIVSDDIDWCKRNLSNLGEHVFFSNESDVINDMRILMWCDYLVLGSASTYSVWASYLNTRKKLVVCPKKLYVQDIYNVHSNILFPQDYIKI